MRDVTRLVFETSGAQFADVQLVPLPLVVSDDDWRMLTPDERTRAGRFAYEAGRSAFVSTRAALRRRLAEETGIAPEALPILTDSHGRPLLRARTPSPFDFNVSHCIGMAAIAVTRGGRIGVDIEARSHSADLRELVPQVMGPREVALLDTLDGDAFLRAFYGSWTRKEAVVKAIGVGLSYPVRTLDLPCDESPGEIHLETAPDLTWRVFTRELEPSVTLSVAMSDRVGSAHHDANGVDARARTPR